MAFTVYVIRDRKKNLYKGVTNDLGRRLKEHARGKTKTTRFMDGQEVVYTEIYETFAQARRREVYLKSAAGRRYLKRILGS